MAHNVYLLKAAGMAMLDTLVDRVDVGGAGSLKVYDGAQAATADTGVGAQHLLATLAFSATAFGSASNADPTVAAAAAITSDSAADATFTATWFRILSGGGTVVFDGTVGTVSAGTEDLQFNTTAFVTGATVAVTALTVTLPLHP